MFIIYLIVGQFLLAIRTIFLLPKRQIPTENIKIGWETRHDKHENQIKQKADLENGTKPEQTKQKSYLHQIWDVLTYPNVLIIIWCNLGVITALMLRTHPYMTFRGVLVSVF